MFSTAVWIVIVLVVIYIMYVWMTPVEGFYYKSQLPPHAMPEKMRADKISYTLGGGFERV